jgi:2-polyprenyl-6-methoxyphenol hydroxylase-like FAD-dependent oxidoreductase
VEVVEEGTENVTAKFGDGETAMTTFAVGADGLHSHVRCLWPLILESRRLAGKLALERL